MCLYLVLRENIYCTIKMFTLLLLYFRFLNWTQFSRFMFWCWIYFLCWIFEEFFGMFNVKDWVCLNCVLRKWNSRSWCNYPKNCFSELISIKVHLSLWYATKCTFIDMDIIMHIFVLLLLLVFFTVNGMWMHFVIPINCTPIAHQKMQSRTHRILFLFHDFNLTLKRIWKQMENICVCVCVFVCG